MSAAPRLPEHQQVRIREVAELAGVSTGTVSNTINHPERVRPRTRADVEAAIRQLGFVPNQQARVLTGAASNLIGLLVLDVESPFYMEAAHAVEKALRDSRHFVMLCNSEGEADREADLLRMLAAQRVRGVLLTPTNSDSSHEALPPFPADLPVVLLDYDGDPSQCSISVDNVAGGRLAMEHLLSLGHREIAYLAGPPSLRQFADRATGARRAILDAGLDPDTVLTEVHTRGIGIKDGQHAAAELFATRRPTAVFCGNDMLAFGASRALALAGLRVPDDVALVGYDDIDFAKDWIVPLTSIRQPVDELGRQAAELLLRHSAGDVEHVHEQIVLRPELVVRRSSDIRLSA